MITPLVTQASATPTLPPVPPFDTTTTIIASKDAADDTTEIVSGGDPTQPPPAKPAQDITMTGGDGDPAGAEGTYEGEGAE